MIADKYQGRHTTRPSLLNKRYSLQPSTGQSLGPSSSLLGFTIGPYHLLSLLTNSSRTRIKETRKM